jgi:hypothetical protein
MSKLYQDKVLKTVQLNGSKLITFQMFRSDKKNLKSQEVVAIKNSLEAKHLQVALIRVLTSVGWTTWKNIETFEEYFEGRVKNKQKFDDIFQTQITFIKDD